MASRLDDKRLGQGALLVERWLRRARKEISDLPEEMSGKGEKKKEGERGLGRAPLIPSLHTT